MSFARYLYLGTRIADAMHRDAGTVDPLKGAACNPVRRADGKVIRGRGNALVRFDGEDAPRVVIARRLRLNRT